MFDPNTFRHTTLGPGTYRVIARLGSDTALRHAAYITLKESRLAVAKYEANGVRWLSAFTAILPSGSSYLITGWVRLNKRRVRNTCYCSRLKFPHRRTADCIGEQYGTW